MPSVLFEAVDEPMGLEPLQDHLMTVEMLAEFGGLLGLNKGSPAGRSAGSSWEGQDEVQTASNSGSVPY